MQAWTVGQKHLATDLSRPLKINYWKNDIDFKVSTFRLVVNIITIWSIATTKISIVGFSWHSSNTVFSTVTLLPTPLSNNCIYPRWEFPHWVTAFTEYCGCACWLIFAFLGVIWFAWNCIVWRVMESVSPCTKFASQASIYPGNQSQKVNNMKRKNKRTKENVFLLSFLSTCFLPGVVPEIFWRRG